MNGLHTLESTIAALYGKLPALSPHTRRWIGLNAWWIILIIACIYTVGLLSIIPVLLLTLSLTSTYSEIYSYSGTDIASAVISFILALVSLALLYLAVSPLRQMRRRGWKLLFLNQLVSILSALVGSIMMARGLNLFGLIWSLVVIVGESYFLFQVRNEFGTTKSASTAPRKTVAARPVSHKPIAPQK